MRSLIRYLLPGMLLAVIVACGSDDTGGTNAGDGAELTEIGQALNAANGSEVTVSGFLIVDTDGTSVDEAVERLMAQRRARDDTELP